MMVTNVTGIDFGRPGGDSTAAAIAQRIADGSTQIVKFATALELANAKVLRGLMKYMERRYRINNLRPRGYSRSHWRKIVKATPWPDFTIVPTGAQLARNHEGSA